MAVDRSSFDDSHANLFSIALHYYHNPSITSDKLNKFAAVLLDNIHRQQPTNTFEIAIIATLTHFLNHQFTIICNGSAIPINWRKNIKNYREGTLVISKNVSYYLQLKDQRFMVMLNSIVNHKKIFIKLLHMTTYHRSWSLVFNETQMNGLIDPEYCLPYAAHVLDQFSKEFKHPVQKAMNNEAPTDSTSPLDY